MDVQKNRILFLLERFEQGIATPSEMEELDAWYASFEDEATPILTEAQKQMGKQRLFNQLEQLSAVPPKQRRLPLLRYASAAAVLLITVTFLFWPSLKPANDEVQLARTIDVAPGGDKAVLTLSDGRKIILEDRPDGQVAAEGNTKIIKLNSGILAYQSTEKSTDVKSQLNTISTPIGGQFQVVLSDGTKVWLNAASSITFPNQFNGTVREVSTTGETYFEVARLRNGNKQKVPFRVKTGEQKIEVLGTQFNVNAYGDQKQYQTTLVEGSIRLSQNNASKLLQPGQQANISLGKDAINISETDVEKAIAWKNGLFKFDNTDIISLMKQLERWYPIEVVYEGKIPDERFFGKIERNYTLSEVLKVLQLGQVHFKIDDKINTNGKRKLIVMP